jgi:hypothetical protein
MHEMDFPITGEQDMKPMGDLLLALRQTESRDLNDSGLAEWSIEKFFRINDEVSALKLLEQAIFGKSPQ